MKPLITAAVFSLLVSTGSLAQAQLSRAEVLAELQAARVAGAVEHGEASLDTTPFSSHKTRAQVVAEFHETRRLGLLQRRERAGIPTPTTAQQARITEAGERARAGTTTAQVR